MNIKFFVVQVNSAYNAILGQTMLVALYVVTSVPHFKIKFPTPHVIDEVKRDLDIAQRFYWHTLTSSTIGVSKQRQAMKIEVELFIERATEPLAFPGKETEDVELFPRNKEKIVKIGTRLGDPLWTGLLDSVWTYTNIFAWIVSNIPGIDELVTVHWLSVDPS